MARLRTRKKGVQNARQGSHKGKNTGSERRSIWRLAGRDFRAKGSAKALHVVVSKNLHWILPYLERTHQVLPRLQMPLRINSYRPSLNRKLRTLGTSYYDEGVINLVTHRQIYEYRNGSRRIIKGLRRIPRSRILETLAHELAHLHVPEHNFEHAELTRMIFRSFGLRRTCPSCEGVGHVEMECNPH